jgi:hypothetical protein
MKNLIVLLCSLVLLCSCLPHRPAITDEWRDEYVGKWSLYYTTQVDSTVADSSDYICLFSDWTFTCTFNILQGDTSDMSGTWDMHYFMDYYDAGYLGIKIEMSGSEKWFNLSQESDGTFMRWDELEWLSDDLKYKWKYVNEE